MVGREQSGEVELNGLFLIMEEPEPMQYPTWPEGTRSADGTYHPSVGPGVIAMMTGAQRGSAAVQVTALDGPPTAAAENGWDESFELQIESSTGATYFWPGGAPSDENPINELLTLDGPGFYKIRIHANGRAANVGYDTARVPEQYRIQIWKI